MDVDLRMSQCFQRFLRLGVHPGIIQQQSLLNGTPHKNVIRDRQLLDDVQLLIHTGDACLAGLNRVFENDLLAVHKDFPFFRSVNAGEHLDQGGFTCAVFSDQTVDLTGSDADRHIF